MAFVIVRSRKRIATPNDPKLSDAEPFAAAHGLNESASVEGRGANRGFMGGFDD